MTRALASAADMVASRPAILHAGPDDAFVRQAALSSLGWQYIPYERTYRGLPVIGGDFVVAVDPAGRVRSTSVAQKAAIAGVDTQPTLTRAAAEDIASGRIVSSEKVLSSRLVMDASGSAPKLVWEVVVSGRGPAGDSLLTVEVEAATGLVLRTRDLVSNDVGHPGLNGPDPLNVISVPINTTSGGPTTWVLGVPAGGLSCEPSTVKRVDPQPLVWGDGDPTHKETACVDAVYSSEQELEMLRVWLGRNGLGAAGGGFAISMDDNLVDNSHYTEVLSTVHIGHHTDGVWEADLETVAHENGHGVDENTPGGTSGGGTKEFIADAFAIGTEWYTNEPAPYDTPDFWIFGRLPQAGSRTAYDPALHGGERCFDSTVTPTDEVHSAAGVGDHWFYLLAEGSKPTDGQPDSPTCNNQQTPAGVGVQKAMQILYNAMLMKTSNSSYPAYRLWTLTAANNLFPGDCTVFNQVRGAWDAVSVPPPAR